MKVFWRSAVASLLIALQAGTVFGRVYVIRPGDTLSEVVKKQLGNPVYGKQGKLKRVLELNPSIRNSGLVYPGQSVVIDAEAEPPAAPLAKKATPTPAAPVSAAQAETVATASEPQRARSYAKFGLDLELLLGTTRIEATSADRQFEATPKSRLNRGLQLRGSYFLSPNSQLGFELAVLQSEFSESNDKRLSEVSKNLKRGSIYFHQTMVERFHAEMNLGTEQVYFLSRVDQAQFVLDPIFIDFLRLSLSYDLIKDHRWRWNLGLLGKLNQASNGAHVDADAGHSYGAETTLSWNLFEELYLNSGLEFERRVQDSTQVTQRNSDTRVKFGLSKFW